MSTNLKISRGLDLQGLQSTSGFVLLLAGIVLLFAVFSWFSLMIFLLGFYLLFRVKTAEFDSVNHRVRFITTYSFLIRLGEWRSFEELDSVYLESSYDTERSILRGDDARRSYRSFLVSVKLLSGEKLLINETDDYKKAFKWAQQVSEYTGLPLINVYTNLQKSSVRRRRRRGYY